MFLVVKPDGVRGKVTLLAPHMTETLRLQLHATGLPDHYTMHSFRVEGALKK